MIRICKPVLFLLLHLLLTGIIDATTPVGQWLTFDEKNGDTLSIVEIYKQQDKLHGRIERIFLRPHQGPNGICAKCEGDNYQKPIVGLPILSNFKKSEEGWKDGRILDPASGKSYRASATLIAGRELRIEISTGPFGLFKQTRILKRNGAAESISSTWVMYDNRHHAIQAFVQIDEDKTGFIGRIVETRLLPDEGPEAICINCPDTLRNRPLRGLEILRGLSFKDGNWQGGKILDPGNGKTYRCSVKLENPDRLRVRGHLGPFSRSQLWHRVQAIKGPSSQF